MAKCSYCNREFERGSGIMLIRNTGKILNFCSKKCETYMLELRRKAKKLKWTRPEKTK